MGGYDPAARRILDCFLAEHDQTPGGHARLVSLLVTWRLLCLDLLTAVLSICFDIIIFLQAHIPGGQSSAFPKFCKRKESLSALSIMPRLVLILTCFWAEHDQTPNGHARFVSLLTTWRLLCLDLLTAFLSICFDIIIFFLQAHIPGGQSSAFIVFSKRKEFLSALSMIRGFLTKNILAPKVSQDALPTISDRLLGGPLQTPTGRTSCWVVDTFIFSLIRPVQAKWME